MPTEPSAPYAGPMYAPRPAGWAHALRAGPGVVRDRIDANIARQGLAYPWWIPLLSFAGQIGCVVVALSLREALAPPSPVALTLLLVGLPSLTQLVFGYWLVRVEDAAVIAAAVWLLSDPVSGVTTVD